MACTGNGLIAIIILFVAVILNVIGFIMPLWTTSDIVNVASKDSIQKADFTSGIWGYCTDVEIKKEAVSNNKSVSFDHCYMFHTSKEFKTPDIDPQWSSKIVKTSVCDGYGVASKAGSAATKVYSGGLAMIAGMDPEQFDVFLHRSCSGAGTATLVFASFASGAGVLAFIGAVLGVTCCKNKSSFNAVVKFLISFAMVSSVLTWSLWLYQSKPLGKKDHVTVGGSFWLAVISTILFLLSGILLARHRLTNQ